MINTTLEHKSQKSGINSSTAAGRNALSIPVPEASRVLPSKRFCADFASSSGCAIDAALSTAMGSAFREGRGEEEKKKEKMNECLPSINFFSTRGIP